MILGGVLTASWLGYSYIFHKRPDRNSRCPPSFEDIAESRSESGARHLDLLGAATVTIGLSLLAYALTEAANSSLLSSRTLTFLGLSAIVLASFLII